MTDHANKTIYQGFEVVNPAPPSNSNGVIDYPQPPAPVDIAGKPVTVVLSAGAMSVEEATGLIDNHYVLEVEHDRMFPMEAMEAAAKLNEKIKKGDFSDLPEWLEKKTQVELSGSLQWIQAADPQTNPTSKESSVQVAFVSGVTSSETETKSFATSIGVSISAGYGPVSATLTTSFTATRSSTDGIAVEKQKSETHDIPIPANSAVQVWQLQLTFKNKAAEKSITTQGPILPLYVTL